MQAPDIQTYGVVNGVAVAEITGSLSDGWRQADFIDGGSQAHYGNDRQFLTIDPEKSHEQSNCAGVHRHSDVVR